jgi:hypothetical protein
MITLAASTDPYTAEVRLPGLCHFRSRPAPLPFSADLSVSWTSTGSGVASLISFTHQLRGILDGP